MVKLIKEKVTRIYHPYWLWEDFNNGMYEKDGYSQQEEMEKASTAKKLLSNPELFEHVALKVISEWKFSSAENLSNLARNRQAWLGQASCCYNDGIPEYITKYGWHLMTPKQQKQANLVADKIIKQWEDYNCRKNTSLKMFWKQVKKE